MMKAQSDAVTGERGASIVGQASTHSRLSNFMALGLMIVLGGAVLTAYYMHSSGRQARVHPNTRSNADGRALAEAPLPALEPMVASAVPEPPVAQGPPTAPTVPLPVAAPTVVNAVARPTTLERRLGGSTFSRSTGPALVAAGSNEPSVAKPLIERPEEASNHQNLIALPATDFGAVARARLLPSEQLLLPKGAFIDCTLETAIDSTLPGMTTCVTATDTFGADGRVVLLERGSKLVGETRGQVQQGSARVFVIWTEARTPSGVIVPLESPGADELGRSGLAGTVDRHFWQRFGAALLISTVDAAAQAAVESASHGSGAIIYNPSATTDVATEVLKSTLSIAPTVRKDNGDRIQILVARDIDFTSVYELRHVDASQ